MTSGAKFGGDFLVYPGNYCKASAMPDLFIISKIKHGCLLVEGDRILVFHVPILIINVIFLLCNENAFCGVSFVSHSTIDWDRSEFCFECFWSA